MKKTFIVFLFFLIFFLPVCAVLGNGDNGGMDGVDITEPSQITSILEGIRNWMWAIFSVVVTICFLVAAFYFVTSSGNPEGIQKGKDMVKYGIIGVLVAFIGIGAMSIVESLLELGNGAGGVYQDSGGEE